MPEESTAQRAATSDERSQSRSGERLRPTPRGDRGLPHRGAISSSVTIDARLTVMIYTEDQPSALLFVDFPIPRPSRRKPAAMRLTHGRWTRSRGAGHDSLRASVGSTDASASLLARVGVVGPTRARPWLRALDR